MESNAPTHTPTFGGEEGEGRGGEGGTHTSKEIIKLKARSTHGGGCSLVANCPKANFLGHSVQRAFRRKEEKERLSLVKSKKGTRIHPQG